LNAINYYKKIFPHFPEWSKPTHSKIDKGKPAEMKTKGVKETYEKLSSFLEAFVQN
jgi:hypothetical protein